MLAQGKKPHTFDSAEQAVEYYKQMYDSEKLKRKLLGNADSNNQPSGKKKGKRKRESSSKEKKQGGNNKEAPKCGHCGKLGHLETKCWLKNPELRPNKKPRKQEAHVVLGVSELKKLVANQAKKESKKADKNEDPKLSNYLASL